MGIQLIRKEERLVYKCGDSKIFYRRISTPKQNAIITANSKKGNPNWEKIQERFLDWVVTGWDTVTAPVINDDGEVIKSVVIPYTPEEAYSLPADVCDDLLRLAGASTLPHLQGEDERKNSTTTSQQD